MKRIEKPWGYEIIWAQTERYVGKKLFIIQGESLSRQYHEVKDETIYVIEGKLKLELGDPVETTLGMGPGASCHITPNTVHRMIALTDVTICEVSTPELDDIVRLEDNYGRA